MHKNRIPRRSFEHETAKTQVSQGLSIEEHLKKKKSHDKNFQQTMNRGKLTQFDLIVEEFGAGGQMGTQFCYEHNYSKK